MGQSTLVNIIKKFNSKLSKKDTQNANRNYKKTC